MGRHETKEERVSKKPNQGFIESSLGPMKLQEDKEASDSLKFKLK
jgi:hypothetical protein